MSIEIESYCKACVCVIPDGSVGSPCGACREILMQLLPENGNMEILQDFMRRKNYLLTS